MKIDTKDWHARSLLREMADAINDHEDRLTRVETVIEERIERIEAEVFARGAALKSGAVTWWRCRACGQYISDDDDTFAFWWNPDTKEKEYGHRHIHGSIGRLDYWGPEVPDSAREEVASESGEGYNGASSVNTLSDMSKQLKRIENDLHGIKMVLLEIIDESYKWCREMPTEEEIGDREYCVVHRKEEMGWGLYTGGQVRANWEDFDGWIPIPEWRGNE